MAEADAADVFAKPRREELASRAMRMFSSVRMLPDGDVGDTERVVSFGLRWLVLMGGGAQVPSEDLGLGGVVVASPIGVMEPEGTVGVSLTMGEY